MSVTRRALFGGAALAGGVLPAQAAPTSAGAASREILQAGRFYYFRNDGDDANDGLEDTPARAFKTAQRAWDVVADLDLNGKFVRIQHGSTGTIERADGGCPVDIGRFPIGNGTIYFVGDVANPAAHVLRATAAGESAFRTRNSHGPNIDVRGFAVQSSTGNGLQFGHVGFGFWGWCIFGACPAGRHVLTDQHMCFVTSSGPYWISGDAESHIYADLGIVYPAHLCTFLADVNIQSFLRVGFRGFLIGKHASYDMNGKVCVGRKFRCQTGGVIDAEDRPRNHFPGTIAGSESHGGYYIAEPTDGYGAPGRH